MLQMFYSSLEKEGLCLKDFRVSHDGGQPVSTVDNRQTKNLKA